MEYGNFSNREQLSLRNHGSVQDSSPLLHVLTKTPIKGSGFIILHFKFKGGEKQHDYCSIKAG